MVWIVVVAIELIHEDVEATYAIVDVVVFAAVLIMAEIGDFIVGLVVVVLLPREPILQGINKFPHMLIEVPYASLVSIFLCKIP